MPNRERKQRALYFAEEWDLDTPAKMREHARRFVTIDVMVEEPSPHSVFSLPPSQRLSVLKTLRNRRMKRLAAAVDRLRTAEVVQTPHGLRCKLRVANLDRIRRLPGVSHVWVRGVQGLRRSRRRTQEEWFAVRGRVMIQVEGQKKGLQSYEDRILLVRAPSSRVAERRALREFFDYAKLVYLDPSGRMIRRKLEKIVDVYETDLEEIDPKGTEVWSSLHSRRMRKEYEWHSGR